MTKQETTPNQPAYKLSLNNSLLTLSNGKEYHIDIETAMRELLGNLPDGFNLRELHDKVFMIKDHIEETIPDDMNIQSYKHYCKNLNAFAHFFGALFLNSAGGNND